MTAKSVLFFLGKLTVGALAFVAGMLLGGIISTSLGMAAPTLPPEFDANTTVALMFATSPLLVLALYFVNRGLAGGWLAHTAILFLFCWIAYSVNNVIEAAIFTSYETGPWFTLINFMPAVFLSAAATAWLFPSLSSNKSMFATWNEFFQSYTPSNWMRLLLAAVIFMPIYYLFGLLVVPFVGDTYYQGESGLTVPSLRILLLVLFGRSLLFFIACLPVVVAWQGGRLQLIFSLGFALFVLVGLLYMLAATWIPASIRVVHSLEILADSFVYAAALVWLLTGQRGPARFKDAFGSTAGQHA